MMNSSGGILKSTGGRNKFDEDGTATYGQQGFTSKTSFNQTQGSMGGGANPGSLKGKLMSLEVSLNYSDGF